MGCALNSRAKTTNKNDNILPMVLKKRASSSRPLLSVDSIVCQPEFQLIAFCVAAGGCKLHAHVLFLGRIVVGAIAFVVGIGMVIGANRIFQRIGTNARPSQPTLALATIGISHGREIRCMSAVASRSLASQSVSPSIGSPC